MRTTSKTESAQAKQRIQELLRKIGLQRQKGKCFFEGKVVDYRVHQCSGWRADGELVMQYDHLNSRAYNVSYANPDCGVVICKGLHLWKKYHKDTYDKAARKYIGKKRRELWDRVADDKKIYPMSAYDWMKCELALKEELKNCECVLSW